MRWLALVLVSGLAGGALLRYATSEEHALHDPIHALQQFDYFYLEEPAAGLDRLGVEPGTPAVIVFCPDVCGLPQVEGAQVVVSSSFGLAQQYALATEDGRVGPGYALVDSSGNLRYRSFDPGLHEQEIQILVDALA